MLHRLLFLLGGPIFDAVAEEFVPAAGGEDASVVLLLFGGFKEEYLSDYIQPWEKRGISKYQIVIPQSDGTIDIKDALAKIGEASGVFIGGGPTHAYQKLYIIEPIKSSIYEKYRQGIPIAGLSAGAMILPEVCVDGLGEKKDLSLQILEGMDLMRNCIIAPHFTEWNVLPKMLQALAQTNTRKGWGIDDAACAVFKNEDFAGVIGQSVYQVTMRNFSTKDYRIEEKTKVFKSS